jgi:hypothetical protein
MAPSEHGGVAMSFTARDAVATGLIGAAVAAYGAYLTVDEVAFVHDVRGMAAVALGLGFASRRIGGTDMFAHRQSMRVASIACVVLGFTAFFTERAAVLAALMAVTIGLCVIGTFAAVRRHGSDVAESELRASKVTP